MVWKDKKWMKARSKWKCKIDTCIVVCSTKWLLTKHLKEMHGLMVEKVKHDRLSTFERGIRHQDHVKMNVHIVGNAMAM
jgi:hypothetical protein